MSFGNMGSTQRLFRRVASNNSSDSSRPDGTSRSGGSNEENVDPAPQTARESTSKEALLGHRVFSKALEPAMAELHAQTSGQQKREALAKLSDAFAQLDAVDPEGSYHLVQGLISTMSNDKKLSQAFLLRGGPAPDEPKAPVPEGYTHGTVINMNKRADQTSAPASPAKILFNSANPHLRSHRRRRGSQAPSEAGAPSAKADRPDERQLRDLEKAALEARFPGREAQPGMEHCKQLSELLYGRWVSNLHTRWPGIATGQ